MVINMMKEREFLKALNNLRNTSNTSIDVYASVESGIRRMKLTRVFLLALAIFPFSLYALVRVIEIGFVRHLFLTLLASFKIEFISFGSHPFLNTIFTIISISFAFSLIISFIVEGGEDEMLLP